MTFAGRVHGAVCCPAFVSRAELDRRQGTQRKPDTSSVASHTGYICLRRGTYSQVEDGNEVQPRWGRARANYRGTLEG